ncbi:hypothetical protein [Bradyrhizobium sp. RDM4]
MRNSMKAYILTAIAMTILMTWLTREAPAPTPDQLYGCTVAQQAPNGECE